VDLRQRTAGERSAMNQHAHDALFKETFTNLQFAASLWQERLPDELSRAVDWSQLQLAPNELLNPELRESEVDLLYQLPFVSELALGDEPVFLYLLYEHQSSNERWMNLRLLTYQVKIWEQFLKNSPSAKRLPILITMVLHHGPTSWNGEVRMLHSYQLPGSLEQALQGYLVDFTYILDDIRTQSSEDILSRTLPDYIKLVLLCLKYVRYADTIHEAVEHWKHVFQALLRTPYRAQLITIIHYLHYCRKETTEQVNAVVSSLLKAPKDIIMTSAEQLIQKGEIKGAALSIVAVLHARKHSVPPQLEHRLLSCTDANLLQQAIVLAATCESIVPLEELFQEKLVNRLSALSSSGQRSHS
jgi:predicted transposase/invertase (TIGR01784 family)